MNASLEASNVADSRSRRRQTDTGIVPNEYLAFLAQFSKQCIHEICILQNELLMLWNILQLASARVSTRLRTAVVRSAPFVTPGSPWCLCSLRAIRSKHPVAFSGDSKNRLWLFYLSHIWAFAVVAYVASPTTPAAAATASANGSNSIMLTMLKLFVCVAYRPSVGHPSRHFPRACSYDGSSRKATSALLDPATTTAEAAAPNPNRPD